MQYDVVLSKHRNLSKERKKKVSVILKSEHVETSKHRRDRVAEVHLSYQTAKVRHHLAERKKSKGVRTPLSGTTKINS